MSLFYKNGNILLFEINCLNPILLRQEGQKKIETLSLFITKICDYLMLKTDFFYFRKTTNSRRMITNEMPNSEARILSVWPFVPRYQPVLEICVKHENSTQVPIISIFDSR